MTFSDEQTPAEEYARSLVKEALQPYPHAWFYEAKFSWLVWFGYTFGHQTFFVSFKTFFFGVISKPLPGFYGLR